MAGEVLEPGCLMKEAKKARISVMLNNNPGLVKSCGFNADQATESEAHELYAAMDARFRAWTGNSLRNLGGQLDPTALSILRFN